MSRRNTRQRTVILEVVRNLGCHPTAERVYDEVRKILPGTSLSTVYRNLGILVDQDLITIVKGTGKEVHYDHNMCEHCHAVCSECGRICDVDVNLIDMDSLTSENLSGFTVREISVNLVGICSGCSEKGKDVTANERKGNKN